MTVENSILENVWVLLRRHFPPEQYAFLREVRDEAGYRAQRTADAIVMNLWNSRGLEVHGIELKSFRGDWLKELKTPAKADAIFKYCDRWWIVADKEDVVKREEVPPTWGFKVMKGGKIFTPIVAPKLSPVPLTKGFVAAMLKRATMGVVHIDEIEDRIQAERREEAENVRREDKYHREELQKLKAAVDAFQETSGVRLEHWNHGQVADAVSLLVNGGAKSVKRDLLYLQSQAKEIHESIERALAQIPLEPDKVMK